MSMFDDLARMKAKLDAIRPDPRIDIVLSTRCPVMDDKSIRVFFEGKWYLIAHWVTVRKIEAEYNRNQPRPPIERVFALSPFGTAQAVENELLVVKILRYIDEQPNNGFVLTKEARRWAQGLI